VGAAQASVTTARGVWETSRVVLAELLALPGAQIPEATTLPPLADEVSSALVAPDETTWLARAMRNRPDLAQLAHLVDAASENVRVAKGQFIPTLTLTGSYGWERRSTISYGQDDQASAMGVELSWRLFTGGFRTAQLRRYREEQREMEARHARARLRIASEVRQAIITLINAQETVRLERLALDAATENRRIIREQYAAGKAALVRLNEAQRDYVQSDVNVTAARVRLRQAWADLYAASAAYAEGVSWSDFGEKPPS
jgi:outer membrane protein TolC